jgi:peptidoglycan/LPS O-acetylase OafA/YrhL
LGAFRLFLATAVMLAHFSYYPQPIPYLIPGGVGVEAFYMVSGFLISMVLISKYDTGSRGSLFLFYSNRALRIYPLYFTVLMIYIAANWLMIENLLPQVTQGGLSFKMVSALDWYRRHADELGILDILIVWFLNIAIFGQDIVRGFGSPIPDLYWHQFIYVRVAWSVAVELNFYLIAPFVIGRFKLTLALLIASLSLQIWFLLTPETRSTFDYEFFPLELFCFMSGSIAYRIYQRLNRFSMGTRNIYTLLSVIIILLATVFYREIPNARLPYLFLVFACLPGIMLSSECYPYDRILGDLSYPIYLVHPIFMIIILPGSTRLTEIVAIGMVFAISWFLVMVVDRPVDRFRQQRIAGKVSDSA